MTNKLLPVALVAALIGGSVGAVVMHSRNQTAVAEPQGTISAQPATATDVQYRANAAGREQVIPVEFNSAPEQTAYKSGFADGFRACESGASGNQLSSTRYQSAQPGVVYRNGGRSYAHTTSSSRTVTRYAAAPRGRSFWQKHRDKLTVAAGTGGGALIGGLIGGRKGAAIGALGGAGGSALYTYKIRKRNRRY
ncbi:MAG: hypothetical protein ABJC10_13795 [Acidobacteriota bacterium]